MPTGYRHGDIGAYTGDGSIIAWKVLDHEYSGLKNEHLLKDVARFLRVPATFWSEVIGKFRDKYGNRTGVWLTKTQKAADELYGEYGPLRKYEYDKKNIISNLGYDGFFVLLGSGPAQPAAEDKVGEEADAGQLEQLEAPNMPRVIKRKRLVRRNAGLYPTGLGAVRQ